MSEVTRQDIDNIYSVISNLENRMQAVQLGMTEVKGRVKMAEDHNQRNEARIDKTKQEAEKSNDAIIASIGELGKKVDNYSQTTTQQIQAIEIENAKNEGSGMAKREVFAWVCAAVGLIGGIVAIVAAL